MSEKKWMCQLGLSFVFALLVAVPVLGIALPAVAADKIVLNTETGLPQSHEQTWGGTGKPWTEAVAKRSNGAVEFKLHFGGELSSMIDLLRGIGSGVVNVGSPYTGYYPSEFAMETYLGSLTIPSFRLPEPQRMAMTRILYADIPAFSEAYKKSNVKKIFTISCPGWGIVSRVPVTTLKDLKGLKIRTFGTYIPKMISAAGAVPVTIPFSEVLDAMQKKVVDGTFVNLSNARDSKLYEVAKHIVMCGAEGIPGYVSPYAWAMNLDVWNKLPSDIKRLMLEEGKRVEMEYARYDEEEQLRAARQMEKAGATLHTLSEDVLREWDNNCKGFEAAAAKDLDGKKLPGTEAIEMIKNLSKLPMPKLMELYEKAWEKEFAMIK